MKLNSPQSLLTGRRMVWHYGSWEDVRSNSTLLPSGVYMVNRISADCDCGCQSIVSDEPRKSKKSKKTRKSFWSIIKEFYRL